MADGIGIETGGVTKTVSGMIVGILDEAGIEIRGWTKTSDFGSSGCVDSALMNSSWGKRAESLE